MTFVTLAVITALCLAFTATRKYGVVGTGLLLYFQPILTIGVLLLVGAGYYYYRRKFA
jgi:hypothetical protein